MSAKAVIFGVPRGVEWDVDAMKRRDDEMLLVTECPGQPRLTAEDLEFLQRISTLKYRNGYGNIPLWFERDGKYWEAMPITGASYCHLLAKLQELLVSLGATPELRQPMRHIELYAEADRRRFVEVELIMAEDNTVRLEILGLRTEDQGICVSSTANGIPRLPPRGPLGGKRTK